VVRTTFSAKDPEALGSLTDERLFEFNTYNPGYVISKILERADEDMTSFARWLVNSTNISGYPRYRRDGKAAGDQDQ
jgi:hypothetical protein